MSTHQQWWYFFTGITKKDCNDATNSFEKKTHNNIIHIQIMNCSSFFNCKVTTDFSLSNYGSELPKTGNAFCEFDWSFTSIQ